MKAREVLGAHQPHLFVDVRSLNCSSLPYSRIARDRSIEVTMARKRKGGNTECACAHTLS